MKVNAWVYSPTLIANPGTAANPRYEKGLMHITDMIPTLVRLKFFSNLSRRVECTVLYWQAQAFLIIASCCVYVRLFVSLPDWLHDCRREG
eukprot:COSAG02_NODE_4151_length_5709_cov_21.395187_4_plen_91_part_00